MRLAQLRHTHIAPTLAMGALLATVGVTIWQTQPAAALDSANASARVPLESYAWLIPATPKAPALPNGPITTSASAAAISGLQVRLAWTGLPNTWTRGTFDKNTVAAVKAFQSRHKIKATGHADTATVNKLRSVARNGQLDPRCLGAGITICVDKTQFVTRFVKDGKVIKAMNSQFGPEKGDKEFKQYSRTREGVFKVQEKKKHSISNLYGYDLPFWMQFDGGEGFHYSGYFDEAGFKVTSYGCIISDSKADSAWLFDHTPKGTKVVVYH